MEVKLSIIIPVYNVAAYLPDTVECVLAQTFRDFELILVDDGSTDGSGAICDRYAAQDARIRVIHQTNGGVSAARNAGLDAATGEFIGWVDSDDIIEKDMFAVMMALAENADIVQCQHDRADTLNNAARCGQVSALDGPAFLERLFTKTGGSYTNQVALWSKIYHRALWSDIRFPVGQVYEDEMQTYKVCLKAKKIIETPDILYHYVKRDNSIITAESPKKMLDKQLALADRLHYLPQKMPELEKNCALSYYQFCAHILPALYGQDKTAYRLAKKRLQQQRKLLRPHLDKYGRLYLSWLGVPGLERWLMKADFEPIQNIIRKFKRG